MSSAADMLVDVGRSDRADDPRLQELRRLIARRNQRELARQLGTTRWASPPPGMSVRAAVLILLTGNFGLFLLLYDLGYFR